MATRSTRAIDLYDSRGKARHLQNTPAIRDNCVLTDHKPLAESMVPEAASVRGFFQYTHLT